MTIREIIGLLVIVVAVVLTPVAWAFSRNLWAVSLVLLVVGSWLFYTERVYRRQAAQEADNCGSSQSGGRVMPSDIHDYSGWGSGGHSDTMDGHDGEADV